ncbi:glucuronate isomerase [Escherichia coli]|uniref:Glucuronate isomerase n=1 Tax=Escherichia coli TaxID=562 RepID=A0A376VYC3_ECOLX|nr:glucuronate isomerase [Escherichia coli]
MTPFMTEDFLLDTEFARRLYHDYAKRPADFRLPLPFAAAADCGRLSF